MRQLSFLEEPEVESSKYTTAVGSPVYTPRGEKPCELELVDRTKTDKLVREIELSQIPADQKSFLIAAAQRHLVFRYDLIAEYYAHATPEVQELMERSALVIIDFNKAIENGYVKLCEHAREIFEADKRA